MFIKEELAIRINALLIYLNREYLDRIIKKLAFGII